MSIDKMLQALSGDGLKELVVLACKVPTNLASVDRVDTTSILQEDLPISNCSRMVPFGKNRLAMLCDGYGLYFLDWTEKKITQITRPKFSVRKDISAIAALSHQRLALGYYDGTIEIWDLLLDEEPNLFSKLKHKSGSLVDCLTPLENDCLASGSISGDVYIWNLRKDKAQMHIPSGFFRTFVKEIVPTYQNGIFLRDNLHRLERGVYIIPLKGNQLGLGFYNEPFQILDLESGQIKPVTIHSHKSRPCAQLQGQSIALATDFHTIETCVLNDHHDLVKLTDSIDIKNSSNMDLTFLSADCLAIAQSYCDVDIVFIPQGGPSKLLATIKPYCFGCFAAMALLTPHRIALIDQMSHFLIEEIKFPEEQIHGADIESISKILFAVSENKSLISLNLKGVVLGNNFKLLSLVAEILRKHPNLKEINLCDTEISIREFNEFFQLNNERKARFRPVQFILDKSLYDQFVEQQKEAQNVAYPVNLGAVPAGFFYPQGMQKPVESEFERALVPGVSN